jgi:carbonic anhydrase
LAKKILKNTMFAVIPLMVSALVASVTSTSIGVAISPFSAGTGFGYDGDVAPEYWPEMYPTCGGQRQSPLNIISSNAINVAFPQLVMSGYDNSVESSVILNNGHTGE